MLSRRFQNSTQLLVVLLLVALVTIGFTTVTWGAVGVTPSAKATKAGAAPFNPTVPVGGSGTFPGTVVAGGLSELWLITGNAGEVFYASSSQPNGWNVVWTGSDFTVSAPPDAVIGPDRLVQRRISSNQRSWAVFDVVAAGGGIPDKPTGLTAFAGNSKVTLNWNPAPRAAEYIVKFSTTPGGPYYLATQTASTSYVHNGLVNGITYYYVVVATNSYGDSPASDEVSATPFSITGPFGVPLLGPSGYLANSLSLPDWLEPTVPFDASDAPAGGPSSAISVNLTNGVVSVSSEVDAVAMNPVGSDLVFAREYRTSLAATGYSSPGLPAGWTHSFDYRIVSEDPEEWAALRFVYPNGSTDRLVPTFSQGEPTGEFTVPVGAPYVATGVPDPENEGQWLSITFSENGTAKTVFEPTGTPGRWQIKEIIEPNGAYVHFVYTAGKLTRVWTHHPLYASDCELNFSYAAPGGLLSLVIPAGATPQSLSYADGKLVGVGSKTGAYMQWEYGYSTVGDTDLLTTVRTPTLSSSDTATIQYDADTGIAKSQTDANGTVRAYTYSEGKTSVLASRSGLDPDTHSVTFDLMGRLTSVKTAANDMTVLAYEHQDPSLVTRVDEVNGFDTSIVYDAKGNMISILLPDSTSCQVAWEYPQSHPFGRPVSAESKDRNGQATSSASVTYYADTNHNTGHLKDQISSVTGEFGTTSFTYTQLGNIKTVTEPGFNGPAVTTFDYVVSAGQTEALGKPRRVTDPIGRQIVISYDARGNVTSTTDPLGRQFAATYNNYDQLLTMRQNGTNNAFRLSYTQGGKPATSFATMDSWGQFATVASLQFDPEYSPVASTGPGSTATFTTDTDYSLKTLTNAVGKTNHSFESEESLRRFSYKMGSGSAQTTWVQKFAPGGLLDSSTSQVGSTLFGHNIYAQPISAQSQVLSGYYSGSTEYEMYAYDPAGRTTVAHNDVTSTSFGHASHNISYTQNGLVSRISSDVRGVDDNRIREVSYDYGSTGARRAMHVKWENKPPVTFEYEYNNIGWVTSIKGKQYGDYIPGFQAAYEYDVAGRVIAVRTPKLTTLYTYNALDQVTAVYNLSPDNVVDETAPANYNMVDLYNGTAHTIHSKFEGITYDVVGQRTGMSYLVRTVENNEWQYRSGAISYGYSSYRLTSESYSQNGSPSVSFSHSYDWADNITKLRGVNWSVSQDGDRPTGIPSALLQSGVSSTLAYDGDGNTTFAWGRSYDYGAKGQLESIRSGAASGGGGLSGDPESGNGTGSWTTHRHYDTGGLLVAADWPGHHRHYLYDGDRLVSSMGNDPASDSYYLWGPTGPVMWMSSGFGVEGIAYDPQGSTVARAAGKQPSESARIYDAYGNVVYPISAPGSLDQPANDMYFPFWYKGQAGCVSDPMTGLVYCHYRYYDPNMGRWITRDPIGLEGGINPYAYCGNNPVMSADPSGLDWLDDFLNWGCDFFGGWGDSLSFGLTKRVRQAMGTDGFVNPSSNTYLAGEVVGMLHSLAISPAKSGGSVVVKAGQASKIAKTATAVKVFLRGDKLTKYLREGFRARLIKASGKVPFIGAQAHHVLPVNLAQDILVRFGPKFKTGEQGLASFLRSPLNGMWVDPKLHAKNAARYNDLLSEWLRINPKGSLSQFYKFAADKSRELFMSPRGVLP